MPSADSPTLIVARFLKSNHYTQSYDAFIAEAGLSENAGDVSKGDLTLETLLEEKRTFDLSARFEKLGAADGNDGWSMPAPSEERQITSLPSRSNLLSTCIETIIDEQSNPQPMLIATTADRRLHVLDTPTCSLQTSLAGLQDAPILSCAVIDKRTILTTSMSGQLLACNISGEILDQRRDHAKYLVKVAIFRSPDYESVLIATAGWDNKISIYSPVTDSTGSTISIGDPIASIPLQTKPESILFLQHPEDSSPVLLISRADSNHIFYYHIPHSTTNKDQTPTLLGKQNLAPHSNAWIAFTPSSLALCPTDPTLLAVGTNSVPHMKLLLIRLLIPSLKPHTTPLPQAPSNLATLLDPNAIPQETQASQARAALAIADREAEAIEIHCTTMAPQTPYSTPAVAWRPDGSGVWVNGDDGAVRGIEAKTGKVVATLQGHEQGSKVRCLWAGNVEGEGEWLVSGGFDQRLVVWRVPSTGSTS